MYSIQSSEQRLSRWLILQPAASESLGNLLAKHILRPPLRPTESNTLEAAPQAVFWQVVQVTSCEFTEQHWARVNSIKYHICHLSEMEAQSIHAKQTPILFQSLCSFYYTHLWGHSVTNTGYKDCFNWWCSVQDLLCISHQQERIH